MAELPPLYLACHIDSSSPKLHLHIASLQLQRMEDQNKNPERQEVLATICTRRVPATAPARLSSSETEKPSDSLVLSSSAITTCLALLSLLSLVVLLLRPALRPDLNTASLQARKLCAVAGLTNPLQIQVPESPSPVSISVMHIRPLSTGRPSSTHSPSLLFPLSSPLWRWVWTRDGASSNCRPEMAILHALGLGSCCEEEQFLIPHSLDELRSALPIFKSRSGAFVLSNTCSVPGRLSFTLTARIQYDAWMPASPSWDWSANARAGPNLIISPAMDSHLGCESACHPSTTVATPVVKFD
ncbi:hypothetical protein TrVFT333_010975 [Trichoderma virens FT-333]|nr:hypothetical protein TrVFT333_010975 [Trichoderma virens FT-333]